MFLLTDIPHPLVDTDKLVYYEDYRMNDSKSMSSVLESIQRIFTDNFVKQIPQSECINPSVKLMYQYLPYKL